MGRLGLNHTFHKVQKELNLLYFWKAKGITWKYLNCLPTYNCNILVKSGSPKLLTKLHWRKNTFTTSHCIICYYFILNCCSWFTVVLVEVNSSQIIAEFFLIFYLVSCSRVTTNVLGIDAYSSQICPICFHLLTHSVVFLHNIIQIQQCYYIGT